MMKKNLLILLAVVLMSVPAFASQVNVFGGYNTSETVDVEILGLSGELDRSVHNAGSLVMGLEYEAPFSHNDRLFWSTGLTYVSAEYAKTLAPHVNFKYAFTPEFYGFVGLNYSFILDSAYEDRLKEINGDSASHDTGSFGAQLGFGLEVAQNLSVELVYESFRSIATVPLLGADVDADIDYSGIRLGLKYGFQL